MPRLPVLALLFLLFVNCWTEPPQGRQPGTTGLEPGGAPPNWLWGSSATTENETVAFMGYDQGCAQLGELSEANGRVSFRVGFALQRPVADRLKHFGGNQSADGDDGPLAGYSVAGMVLLVRAVKVETYPATGDWMSTPVTPIHRFADASARSAAMGSIAGTLLVEGGHPCAPGDNHCRAIIDPTIVIVWQDSTSRTRAYQFLRPHVSPEGRLDRPRFADCPITANGEFRGPFHQSLGVYWPLREDFARRLDGAPDPARWTQWIDEVLPR
jgi:hypothetical protein